ncbi:MAG TPA: c-type cytochrome [Planctomycetaceae bacterium]|nr:c-type cytochrome [Planctomycetaceae bacterium]
MWHRTFLVLFLTGLTVATTDVQAGEMFTQAAEIAPTIHDSGTPVEPTAPLPAGVNAEWIWGANDDKTYFVKTTFTGGSKSARLRAAADNSTVLFLNGKKVGDNDSWNTPSEFDVQKFLKDGENELLAEVKNAGGPAGFLAVLTLVRPDGKVDAVITNKSWKVAESRDAKDWVAVRSVGKYGDQPWGEVLTASAGGDRGLFNTLPGYKVEKLFTVPKDVLGSWVCITTDNKGRFIVSDQGDKGLCRITPAPIGSNGETKVERLDVKMSAAQGMLYAFGSLYVSVNGGQGSGLYRLRDTNNDDQYDEVTKLKEFKGGGEHGPHSLRLTPDGKSIIVVCGNHTLPPFTPGEEKTNSAYSSRMPTNWGEDLLLDRHWDPSGHAAGIMAPGGWIAKTDPDGKTWEILSIGYRNQFDMAYNSDGELFVYDADMEYDFGMPWHRPTRVNHATSGSEVGWRSGSGKWPPYFVDSLPSAVDIGPGSPVGVTFGYGLKFPAKYQKALFICDWTFGTMYAIHISPKGASYTATKEEFVSRTPLPLTDNCVGPDGALYFTVGGRGTQSELFRVTYTGDESTAPVSAHDDGGAELRALRQKAETYHRRVDNPAEAAKFLIPLLAHEDRFIRYAARIGLENQPISAWQDAVVNTGEAQVAINGVVGLARQATGSEMQPALLKTLSKVDFSQLRDEQQLEALRAYQLVFTRTGAPTEADREQLAAKFDRFFPTSNDPVNRELCNLLVYLESPTIAKKVIALLEGPDNRVQPEYGALLDRNKGYGGPLAAMSKNQPDSQKIHYAYALRNLKKGWTIEQRKAYYAFLQKANTWSGGASFRGYLKFADVDSFANATDAERLAIEATGARQAYKAPELPKAQGPGRDWTLESVLASAQNGLKSGRDFKNGQKMFAAARCVVCHRFGGDGGATGPDLTQLAGRFNPKDLTEAIVDPSKVISDQYKASVVLTNNGKTITGRIVSETKDSLLIVTNPEDSTATVEVKKADIDEMHASPTSLMPKDLLKTLNETEVLDLLAYLLSRGNAQDAMFRK